MKVAKTINLLDPNFQLVTLRPGDEVPEWAESKFTNTAVLASEKDENESAPTGGVASDEVAYESLKKDELVALAKERGLLVNGNRSDLIARLEAADAEPQAEGEDLSDLPREALIEKAESMDLEVDLEYSDDELIALIENAQE